MFLRIRKRRIQCLSNQEEEGSSLPSNEVEWNLYVASSIPQSREHPFFFIFGGKIQDLQSMESWICRDQEKERKET